MIPGSPSASPYVQTFAQQAETARASTLEFWKHLTVIEATVLGLTVGLTQATGGNPPFLVAASWVALLLAIAVGSVLAKTSIDLSMAGSIRAFKFAHDVTEIEARVERGDLTKETEEYKGLIAAALSAMPGSERLLTEDAKALAGKYAAASPSAFINVPTPNRMVSWVHRHWQAVELAFYGLSSVAFALLLASVLFGSAIQRSAVSTPPGAIAKPSAQSRALGAPVSSPTTLDSGTSRAMPPVGAGSQPFDSSATTSRK
jgi:hypothetical protein